MIKVCPMFIYVAGRDKPRHFEDALRRSPSEKAEAFAIFEVKEKFGELRCYEVCGTQEISRLILEARWRSRTICEFCGKPGKLRRGMRNQTLCDLCQQRMG